MVVVTGEAWLLLPAGGIHGLRDPSGAGGGDAEEHLPAARGRRHGGGAWHGTARGGAVFWHSLPPDTCDAGGVRVNPLLLLRPSDGHHGQHVQARQALAS